MISQLGTGKPLTFFLQCIAGEIYPFYHRGDIYNTNHLLLQRGAVERNSGYTPELFGKTEGILLVHQGVATARNSVIKTACNCINRQQQHGFLRLPENARTSYTEMYPSLPLAVKRPKQRLVIVERDLKLSSPDSLSLPAA